MADGLIPNRLRTKMNIAIFHRTIVKAVEIAAPVKPKRGINKAFNIIFTAALTATIAPAWF